MIRGKRKKLHPITHFTCIEPTIYKALCYIPDIDKKETWSLSFWNLHSHGGDKDNQIVPAIKLILIYRRYFFT